MGPDYRVLVTEARKAASVYSAKYGEPIPTEQLVMSLATVMQVTSDFKFFRSVTSFFLFSELHSNGRCQTVWLFFTSDRYGWSGWTHALSMRSFWMLFSMEGNRTR